MYIYIIYICIHMYVYVYVHTYIYLYTYICIYIHKCIYTCTCMHMCMCMCMCVYIYICIYICVYIYTYIYMCVYIYIQITRINAEAWGLLQLLRACHIHDTHDAAWYSALWSSAHTATHCNTLQHPATPCNTLQHPATHRNTRQDTATIHCNTLQHTATHCKSSRSSWYSALSFWVIIILFPLDTQNYVPEPFGARHTHDTHVTHMTHSLTNDDIQPHDTHDDCNRLHHTATYCNTHCKHTPQHTLQHGYHEAVSHSLIIPMMTHLYTCIYIQEIYGSTQQHTAESWYLQHTAAAHSRIMVLIIL